MSALPPDQCERIFAGEHPLKVWREHLGLEQTDLRRVTKISVDRIAKIESGRGRPITREEAKLLGRALDVAANNLMPHAKHYSGCSVLDVDEEAILREAGER